MPDRRRQAWEARELERRNLVLYKGMRRTVYATRAGADAVRTAENLDAMIFKSQCIIEALDDLICTRPTADV